jgi:diguanylate cyclase (GGDEF)-like protein
MWTGAYLTAVPLLVYALATLIRFITGLVDSRLLQPRPNLSAQFEVLVLFIMSFLWTAGFVLMINQRLQSALNQMAMFDPLTQIWNRRAMRDKLESEMRRDRTVVQNFSVILIDADHFKRVNDRFGHDVGDTVLVWLVASIQGQLRIHDVVARWGGEEFLILLPNTDMEEAMLVADRLRAAVAENPVDSAPALLTLSISAGVASSTENSNVRDLIKTADGALYVAKKARNQVVSQDSLPDVVFEHERNLPDPHQS